MFTTSFLNTRPAGVGAGLGALALIGLVGLAQSEPAPAATLGPEVQVTAVGEFPAIARGVGGTALIGWGTDCEGVRARRMRGDGTLDATYFFNVGVRDIRHVQAAADAAGNYVVTWQEDDVDGSGFGILAQRVRANGTPRGNLIRVNQLTGRDQTDPKLGIAPDGRFGIQFADTLPLDGGGLRPIVRLARFTPGGRRLGQPLMLPSGERSVPLTGGVAAGSEFLAAGWTDVRDCGTGGDETRSKVAQVAWSGAPAELVAVLADEQVCEAGPLLVGLLPSDFGTLAVLAGHNYNIQRFDPLTGARLGTRIVFAELGPCDDSRCDTIAAVAGDVLGRFVVIWERRETDAGGDHYTLFAQLFGREGVTRSGKIKVSTEPSARPTLPAAIFSENDTLHVVSERASDAAGTAAIFLRTVTFR